MSKKILVTGATGHFGKATIDYLLDKGTAAHDITALVRDENKASDLKNKGVNIIVGDYDNYISLVHAFTGVDKLLLVSGNDIVKRGDQQKNAVKAAKEAGVKHILYTSFERKNETDTSPIALIAKSHIDTEQAIKESGIPYTIFRNNLYMDVLPMFLGEKVISDGVFYPAGDTTSAFTSRLDMAEATANVLMSDGHTGKEYTINNTENYSLHDVAESLSKISNKDVPYLNPDAELYTETLTGAGVPGEYIGLFAGFAEAIKQGEFKTDKTDLEHLLGRKPTTLHSYLTTIYGK